MYECARMRVCNLLSVSKACVCGMCMCVFQCDCSRVCMYQMHFRELNKCVRNKHQGFVCDVNIQGYVCM